MKFNCVLKIQQGVKHTKTFSAFPNRYFALIISPIRITILQIACSACILAIWRLLTFVFIVCSFEANFNIHETNFIFLLFIR